MPDGTPYAASDPHLLRWVHVAEIDSFLRAHQVYGKRPLDQAGRDEYVAQTADGRRAGSARSTSRRPSRELAEALAAYRPELGGTPEAREAVRYVLLRPPLPLAVRPAYGVLAAAAVGLMPRVDAAAAAAALPAGLRAHRGPRARRRRHRARSGGRCRRQGAGQLTTMSSLPQKARIEVILPSSSKVITSIGESV